MSPIADLIAAVASLLWPLLVIVVLLVFGGQLLAKLRGSDDVTLEIGGQKLSIRQATDQQADLIADLQREVAALKRKVDAGAVVVPGDELPWGSQEQERTITRPGDGRLPVPGAGAPHSILWVDDNPENNAMLAESWRRDGIDVEVARSTDEALRLLNTRPYGLIISDLGRRESDVDVPDAGLRLLSRVRANDPVTPFVLYGNTGPYADDARAAGVTLMTGSTFDLVEYVTGLGMMDEV
ncbi:response regulator [Promicromonospora sp. NPDC050880]|uniref:response regulator n=1 Tax=Promicromonospora sp. NPDC050880 TaxID=3364406 RepID=UPI0037ACB059